jgi:hypothetical protein
MIVRRVFLINYHGSEPSIVANRVVIVLHGVHTYTLTTSRYSTLTVSLFVLQLDRQSVLFLAYTTFIPVLVLHGVG